MKTEFIMKEATNKKEAIMSILDVMEQKPSFIQQVDDIGFLLTCNCTAMPSERMEWLEQFDFPQIRDLFIKIKTAYYKSI